MSSLDHARLVDGGSATASTAAAQTPAPARGTARHRAPEVDETNAPKVPTQRQGAARRGTTSAAGRHAAKPAAAKTTAKRPAAAKAAGSLAVKAKAATAAAGSTAARAAAGKAATAKTAAAKAAAAGTASARSAAARATTKAKTAAPAKATTAKPAAAKPAGAKPGAAKAAPAKASTAKPAAAKAAPAKAATAKPATAKPATAKAAQAKAATAKPAKPVTAKTAGSTAAARPTPRPRPAPDGSTAAEVQPEPLTPVVVLDQDRTFTDTATAAALQADPAEAAPGLVRGRRSWLSLRRLPTESRRPAFYLAAALIGALSIGSMVDTNPAASADTASASQSVSVAEQLGIAADTTDIASDVASDGESTRVLQEMAASRHERDAAQVAAADAQTAADNLVRLAAAEAARPKVVLPVNGARLTSGFGSRWGTLHAGIDLAAPIGTPEYAAKDGVVLEAGPASGFGLAVYIQHDNGDVTVYGHMEKILVQPGQVVRAGDTIALLGNRGQSTGPHLHFEVHVGGMNGTKIDPLPWLREQGVQI